MEKVKADRSDYEHECSCCHKDLVNQNGEFYMTEDANFCSEKCAHEGSNPVILCEDLINGRW